MSELLSCFPITETIVLLNFVMFKLRLCCLNETPTELQLNFFLETRIAKGSVSWDSNTWYEYYSFLKFANVSFEVFL